MSLLAVELNDAAVVLARQAAGGIETAGPSPAYALLQGGRVLLGAEAARRSRVFPLYAQNRYWQQLGLERLPWTADGVQTQADLAFAHLSHLLGPVRDSASGLLLAVPPGYTREQLGLLVGVAGEAGVAVRGLVDLGLAACAAQAAAPHLLHLDLQLHQAVVTVLEHARADGALRRTRYEILPGAGLLAIQQALVDSIATAFVRRTRFDPLHEAATDQALVDALPGWIAAAATNDEVTAEITAGRETYSIPIAQQDLLAALEPRLAELQRLVQASRPAGLAVQLCVSAQAAGVPGLLQRLAALRDCVVTVLPEGAAARGALECASAISRPPEAVALVHRLPLERSLPAAVEATAAEVAVPPDALPTHVLYAGRAWPITAEPLVLGSAVGGAHRSLTLPAGTPGLSKSHCSLVRRGAVVQVEDHSTYGTFVNDERVPARLALKVGDVLRLGAPGVELQLIRAMPEDGTT